MKKKQLTECPFTLEIQEPKRRTSIQPIRRDPYRLDGPTLLSFSGGRTSGYMLRSVIDRHGGSLPDDCVTCFANTGRERAETLDFVRECGDRWGVRIVWVEYGRGEVTYETASRDGEPFAALIESRKFLPNPVTRMCTTELKVRPMRDAMRRRGFSTWDAMLGIRADEPRRVANMRQPTKEAWDRTLPLADAGVSVRDVMEFWQSQQFDLQLLPHEGNCDLCYLKGADKIIHILERKPELAEWWKEQERKVSATFRSDRPSYEVLAARAASGTWLPFGDIDELGECQCHD